MGVEGPGTPKGQEMKLEWWGALRSQRALLMCPAKKFGFSFS